MTELQKTIERKKQELARLVKKKRSLQDNEVYKKSCELDRLVVKAMQSKG